MSKTKPYFRVFWGAREQTFGQFVHQTREFLLGLRKVHPAFDTLYVLGDRQDDERHVGPNLEHLEDLALERAWSRETPSDWFTYLDSEGRPTDDIAVDVGWGLGLRNEPEAERTNDHIHLSVHTGSLAERKSANHVLLDVGDSASPLLRPVLSEQVFKYMIDFWGVERALLTEERYRDAVRDDLTREQLEWMNYRADPNFSRFLLTESSGSPTAVALCFALEMVPS